MDELESMLPLLTLVNLSSHFSTENLSSSEEIKNKSSSSEIKTSSSNESFKKVTLDLTTSALPSDMRSQYSLILKRRVFKTPEIKKIFPPI